MKKLLLSLGLGLGIAASSATASSLITTPGAYSGPTLNLTPYKNGSYNFTFGPVNVGAGLTFTAAPGGGGNSGMGSVVGQGEYGLTSNGTFGGDAVYIGVDSGTGYDTITFSTPQTQFYGFYNYSPGDGSDPTLSTLDAMGNVLQSFDLATLAPISTPGGFNQFAFRGIDGTDAFSAIRFGGSYLLLAATAAGDATSATPEPAAWALMIAGFGLVGTALRRRKVLATA
ncbi:MAG: PEPxxWA-CTERM sorting domain-containing protein [Janthinobacterium lividum]